MQIIDPTQLDLSTLVRPGDTVMWGQGSAEPTMLTRALMEQRQSIGPFRALIGMTWADTLKPEHADTVSFLSYCGAGRNRALARAKVLDIWPGHYSDLPRQVAGGELHVDVLMLQLSPPDEHGRYSLSMACEYLAPALASARCIVAEINDQAPWTHGPISLGADDIHYALHASYAPVDAPSVGSGGEVEQAVARRVAGLIDDGATLQCGIGSLPEAVLRQLHDRRDLGLHSGALVDQAAVLAGEGVITNACKTIDRGVSVAGVLMGTKTVRDYAHRNPTVELRSVAYTHCVDVLARIDRFVAINSAIEVDLSGQVNTEVAAGLYVGAVGGANDFVRGAHRSRGGLPIIALPSRASSTERPLPRIVAQLSGPASIPRSDAGIIVTEHGIADLRGLTLAQRMRQMIDIAHPDDREALERVAGMQVRP
ncbi:MAG: acetyl-CoA hydrolase/transferase C-terminal domain-containing protein [Pseudomonas sp.]|uniref:acetyl-CoA hydrolase/transferase family protein n=1 Tax=Pseudomonas sp. TaxID=306 RepID=UPI0039826528